MNRTRLENGWEIIPNTFGRLFYSGSHNFNTFWTIWEHFAFISRKVGIGKTDFLRLIPTNPNCIICLK